VNWRSRRARAERRLAAWIDRELQRVTDADIAAAPVDWHLGSIPDITTSLRVLALGGSTLPAPALRDVANPAAQLTARRVAR
jgi:hypothetical protein